MPTTSYDSSMLTQRLRDRTAANSFIRRIQNQLNPTTGSAPLLGITEASIISTVRMGQMTDYRKNTGSGYTINGGCPCDASPVQTVSTDNAIYVIGDFGQDPLEMYDSTEQLFKNSVNTVNGNNTNYLVKYSKDGIPIWAAKIGSTTGDTNTPSIVVDTRDNIYIAGRTDQSSIGFYNTGSSSPNRTLTMLGNNKVWVAKYNSDGIVQWATYNESSNSFVWSPALAVDSQGNLYVGGWYRNVLNIYESGNDSTPVAVLPNQGNSDDFLIKYTAGGIYTWSTHIGGAGTENPPSVRCDKDDNVFIAGFYSSSPLNIYSQGDQINPALIMPNDGSTDNYLVKYNSSGTALWATRIGGSGGENRANIYADSQGNVYISAFYGSNPLNFYSENDQVTPAFSITITVSTDMYVAKYNSIGIAQWAARISGTSLEVQPWITIDNADNIIVTGSTDSTTIDIYNAGAYGPGPFVADKTITFPGSPWNVFLLTFDTNGSIIRSNFIGSTGIASRDVVTCDKLGNIIISGEYNSTSLGIYDTAGAQLLSLSNPSGNTNTFVVKFSSTGVPLWAAQNIAARVPSISSSFKPW